MEREVIESLQPSAVVAATQAGACGDQRARVHVVSMVFYLQFERDSASD